MSSELTQSHAFKDTPGSEPLQIVSLSGKRVGGAFTASSAPFTLPTGSTLIEVSATENCYLEFGSGSPVAEATIANDLSRLFMAGVQVIPVPLDGSGNPYTKCAVISAGTDGVVQFEKCE
jgi:hypothetical protein